MRHNYWAITLSILGAIIAAGILAVLAINMLNINISFTVGKKSTDSSNNNQQKTNEVTGPLILYYTAIEDDGKSGAKIGCGDSAVAVTTADVTTNDVVKSSFERLLSNKNQWYGESGLYNVLYNSNLKFSSRQKSGDTIKVYLTGTLSLGGVCDNPRVQAVLEMTAEKAANVTNADIYINDKTLAEVLSLK